MNVECSNCGGVFDESESKCPYCGMIYEPGAEKKYSNNLEKIRTGLNNVDDLAVTDFKKEIKQFLITFAISVGTMLLIVLLVLLVRSRIQLNEHEKVIDEMKLKFEKMAEIRTELNKWNQLFDEGQYEDLCERIDSQTTNYRDEISAWKHHNFYECYSIYLQFREEMDYIADSRRLTSESFALLLENVVSLDTKLNDEFYILSPSEKNPLTDIYVEIKAEFLEKCDVSEADYDSMLTQLTENGHRTYISHIECLNIAQERVGENN